MKLEKLLKVTALISVVSWAFYSCKKKDETKKDVVKIDAKYSNDTIDSLKAFYAMAVSIDKKEIVYHSAENLFKTKDLTIQGDSLVLYFKEYKQYKKSN